MTNQRLLFVSFDFPPEQGSSGVHRVLAFARHLPTCGLDVTVLTVNPRAYPRQSADNLSLVPNGIRVLRSFALDAQRHLSLRGKYLSASAVPDRWQSWILPATLRGLWELRRQKHQMVLATYPILSALVVGFLLSKLGKVPLVVDFRDPVLGAGHALAGPEHRRRAWIERKVVTQASAITVTSARFAKALMTRYPGVRVEVVRNGYDEAVYQPLPRRASGTPFSLVHLGAAYPGGRNPGVLVAALALLRKAKGEGQDPVRLRFFGSTMDAEIDHAAAEAGVSDLVECRPAVPYAEVLNLMEEADGLLLLQGAAFDQQVPAKLYEYQATGRAVFSLTTPGSETAAELDRAGMAFSDITASPEIIAKDLQQFVDAVGAGSWQGASEQVVAENSRRFGAETMGRLLREISATTVREDQLRSCDKGR